MVEHSECECLSLSTLKESQDVSELTNRFGTPVVDFFILFCFCLVPKNIISFFLPWIS